MAALDRRRRGELLRGVFTVLNRHPDGIKARDVFPGVEQEVGMTDFEAANYPGSNVRRFEKTVRFVTINAVKAGWMVKEAGVWKPTEEGLRAYQTIGDPGQFLLEAQKLYRAWQREQPEQEPPSGQEETDRELSSTSVTLERAEEDSWDEVRGVLYAMDPYDFQDLVGGLLQGMGYFVEWISPPGKDRGIDIVALSDPVGSAGPRLKVQVKRQEGKADAPTLRAFYSVLHEGDIGVFVNLGGFTADAEAEARAETRRIRLIDATAFFLLWVDHYEEIPEEDRRRLPIKRVPFLAPVD